MDKFEKDDLPPAKRSTLIQIALCLIAYFSTIAPSMSLGFSAVALPGLSNPTNPYRLSDEQQTWFASIASIATPIGCFISGPISDRFGRKMSLLTINAITFLGWLVLTLAARIDGQIYAMLLVGRLITGFSTGLASISAAVYMAEVSSPELRGMFTTASASFFSLGIVIVYFLGYLFKDDWGQIALITSVIPVISMLLSVFLLPESPAWLVSKNREMEARSNLTKIYGFKNSTTEIREEIQTLVDNRKKNEIKKNPANTSFFAPLKKKFKYFTRPTCLKPFLIILTYFFFLQFSGVFVIIFYCIDIVKQAGVSIDPYVAIVAIALTRLIGALSVFSISKRCGRRGPSIFSGVFITVCMLGLSAYLYCKNEEIISKDLAKQLTWIPLTLLVVYFFTSAVGFLTVPFAMAAEVFPTKIRGLASGLVTCLAYGFNFITVKTYAVMMDSMGNAGFFCFYGIMGLLGTIFVMTLLPETKGKTLQEIEELFDKKVKHTSEKELLSVQIQNGK
ncbi:Sugar transporter [Popillia japonica]|uniref:Sugar transporter n=1 Tax=Popillia japonica TaxID=7064 RepID=A0AAW1LWG4_POPJA